MYKFLAGYASAAADLAEEFVRDAVDGLSARIFMLVMCGLAFAVLGFFPVSIAQEGRGGDANFLKSPALSAVFSWILPFIYDVEGRPGKGWANFFTLNFIVFVLCVVAGFISMIFNTPEEPVEKTVLEAKSAYAECYGAATATGTVIGMFSLDRLATVFAFLSPGLFMITGITLYCPPGMLLFYCAFGTMAIGAVLGFFLTITFLALKGGLICLFAVPAVLFRCQNLMLAPGTPEWLRAEDVGIIMDVAIFLLFYCAGWHILPGIAKLCVLPLRGAFDCGAGFFLWCSSFGNPKLRRIYRLKPSEAYALVNPPKVEVPYVKPVKTVVPWDVEVTPETCHQLTLR